VNVLADSTKTVARLNGEIGRAVARRDGYWWRPYASIYQVMARVALSAASNSASSS
jgi:hypothetical protein